MDIKTIGGYVTLGQLLKMADFIQSSDEAEFAVGSPKANVNREQENCRGRKLYAGDVTDIEGNVFSLS